MDTADRGDLIPLQPGAHGLEQLVLAVRPESVLKRLALKDGDAVYDLVASNGERRFAVEVKARSALQGAAEQIRTLREQAKRHGHRADA